MLRKLAVDYFICDTLNKPKLFRRTYVIMGERIPYAEISEIAGSQGEYKKITDLVFDRICTLGENFSPEQLKKDNKK